MSTHTPGPWHVESDGPRIYVERRVAEKMSPPRHSAFSQGVCLIDEFTTHARADEAKANARLIAAAPDLAELLRTMVDEFEEGLDHMRQTTNRTALAILARIDGAV